MTCANDCNTETHRHTHTHTYRHTHTQTYRNRHAISSTKRYISFINMLSSQDFAHNFFNCNPYYKIVIVTYICQQINEKMKENGSTFVRQQDSKKLNRLGKCEILYNYYIPLVLKHEWQMVTNFTRILTNKFMQKNMNTQSFFPQRLTIADLLISIFLFFGLIFRVRLTI